MSRYSEIMSRIREIELPEDTSGDIKIMLTSNGGFKISRGGEDANSITITKSQAEMVMHFVAKLTNNAIVWLESGHGHEFNKWWKSRCG